jgi:predicted Zn finger-like uncharacterized protein
LGAGFSIPAGAPCQAAILAEIFNLGDQDRRIVEAKNQLSRFLFEDLHIAQSDAIKVALEDTYTPIDRCIADGTWLRGRSHSQIRKLRDHLGYLISRAIAQRISKNLNTQQGRGAYIDRFAKYLVTRAAHRAVLARNTDNARAAKDYDPLSIICLNWDILLDNALYNALLRDCNDSGDYDPFGVVDYCCYISSLDATDNRIRSGLWSLGCRGYNVKLLKLHGSMNWLQCPNCQRMFVGFGQKLGIPERIGKVKCRHCKKYGHTNLLQVSLVMPTFLKDLSNFQIKLVWQNVGVELMEARRLVFIGYSLPHADFEFRQLLTRMIWRDAPVDVVLFRGRSEESKKAYKVESERYRQFFSGHRVTFHPAGVEEYTNRL